MPASARPSTVQFLNHRWRGSHDDDPTNYFYMDVLRYNFRPQTGVLYYDTDPDTPVVAPTIDDGLYYGYTWYPVVSV